MPLFGTRDPEPLIAAAPVMPNFDTEPERLVGANVLQVLYEIREGAMLSLIPSSLHPTIPPILLFNFTFAPQSPWGPFTLAEVRVGCRAAARPRAFLARCYVDNEAAATGLRSRWGYPVEVATVKLLRGYDRNRGFVTLDGETILDVSQVNPEPISGGDVQYLPNVQMARTTRDGQEIARIVQVDSEYQFLKADRGKPRLDAFSAAAWALDGADPWFPVSASIVTVDIDLPSIRFVIDPAKPAISGVERVN